MRNLFVFISLTKMKGAIANKSSCAAGILSTHAFNATNQHVCCAASCGAHGCGGEGCEHRPGGGSQCCERHIIALGRPCSNSEDTGCLVSSEAVGVPLPVSPWEVWPVSPPCSTEERHQHAAVIFRGDAFRLAACAVRSAPKAAGHPAYQSDSDIALDVQWQLRIYQSYVDNFEKPLRSLNYVVDYFSVQYPTPHDLEVLRFFGPRLKSWIRLNSGTQGVSAVVGLLALQQHCERQDYDFVMLTRHDVQLTRSIVADLDLQSTTTPPIEEVMIAHMGVNQRKRNGRNNCNWCEGKTSPTMQIFGHDKITWCSPDFTFVIGRRLLPIFTGVLKSKEPHWPRECFEPLRESFAPVNDSFAFTKVPDFSSIVRGRDWDGTGSGGNNNHKQHKKPALKAKSKGAQHNAEKWRDVRRKKRQRKKGSSVR